MDEPLDFDKLNGIYREEKAKRELQKLDADFYASLSRYLSQLAIEKQESESKNGQDAAGTIMLRDEYRKAVQWAEGILDMRLRKLMDMARLEVHGAKTDQKNMLKEEGQVKEKLVEIIRGWCTTALGFDYVGLKASPDHPTATKASDAYSLIKTDSAARQQTIQVVTPIEKQVIAQDTSRNESPISEKKFERMVVAVLVDLPPFAGIERNYLLRKGDVVSLSPDIGEVLLKSNKVRRLL